MNILPLKALLLESSESDAQRIVSELAHAGYVVDHERVYSKQGLLGALDSAANWDVIITGHLMPGFSPTEVLLVLLARGIETPLIIISDALADDVAIESVRAGAHDFLRQGEVGRLGISVARALQATSYREQAKAYQQRLRELSAHLEEVREAERLRISREIHDELGGMLTALKMDVRWLQKRFKDANGEADGKFGQLAQHLDTAINTVRRIISELRPSVLDDLGLVAALEWQLHEFEKRYHVRTTFLNLAENLSLQNKKNEIAVFRIFQESLTNIAKHAKASEVVVKLSCNNNVLHLEINDNGIGISEQNKTKKGHYGILGMNERTLSIGGSLEVVPGEEGGTRIRLRLPL